MLDRIARRRRSRRSTTSRCATRRRSCATRSASRATASTGPYTILYHQRRPHAQRAVERAARLGGADDAADATRAARASGTTSRSELDARERRADRRARAAAVQRRRRSLVACHRPRADPVYFVERRRRRAVLRPRGRRHRCARCSATCAFARATTCSCRAACCTASCPTAARAVLALDRVRRRRRHLPKQWRNEVGQLRMDAPYCHRDFKRPQFSGPLDEGIRDVVVKRGGALPRLRASRARRSTSSAGTARSTRGRSRS